MKTRSRPASAANTDQALAAPPFWAMAPRHSLKAGSFGSCGIGSQVHLMAPVRASEARTSPLAGLGRLLSAIEEPVITSPFTTTGGDVMEYAPGSKGEIRRPAFRSTMPLRPNPVQGRPSRASSANSCDCAVATNMRRRQTAPAGADSSSHVDTPRLAKSPYDTSRLIFGSNTQRSRPVAGSSAITRPSGVPRYIVPSTTTGVASQAVVFSVLKRGSVSPVRYVHATARRLTLVRVISEAGL